jgi:hypothetical protein
MVHIYHHNRVGLLRGLPGQISNKLVKRIPVPYTGKDIDPGIGSNDKKVTVEQGGTQTGPDQRPGIQYDIYGRSAAGENHKETNKINVNFIKFFGGNNEFKNEKYYRKITDDEPNGIQFFPD